MCYKPPNELTQVHNFYIRILVNTKHVNINYSSANNTGTLSVERP